MSPRIGRVRRSPPRTASRQTTPSSWRTPSNKGCRSSHHPRRLHLRTMRLRWLRFPSLRRMPPPKVPTRVKRRVSTRAIASPRRYRKREHLRYVAQQPCLLCGRKPSDPHHLGFTQPRALGRKVSDEFVVPLCRGHHRAVHRSRDERAWWRQAGVDPIKVARRLWKATRGMGQRGARRPALARPLDAAAPSDPSPKGEGVSAAATTQEETRLPDLPG